MNGWCVPPSLEISPLSTHLSFVMNARFAVCFSHSASVPAVEDADTGHVRQGVVVTFTVWGALFAPWLLGRYQPLL